METQASPWFRGTAEGLNLLVRLTPGSSADVIEGIGETADERRHLKVRVRAVPEGGKANRALEKAIAKWLGIAKSSVTVTGGAASRLKSVTVNGESHELLRKIALAEKLWTGEARLRD